jgi:hypothetical protein
MQVASALDLLRLSLAVSNCWEQKGREDSNDGGDDQQLN